MYDEYDYSHTLGEYECGFEAGSVSFGDSECGFDSDSLSLAEYECGCDYDYDDI